MLNLARFLLLTFPRLARFQACGYNEISFLCAVVAELADAPA
jgi:hypothetical protein